MNEAAPKPRFLVCVDNAECEDLQVRRLYQALPDPDAELHGMIRVVDDSGEDFLYPEAKFLPVALPETVERALVTIA